jgi:hypothetical protein
MTDQTDFAISAAGGVVSDTLNNECRLVSTAKSIHSIGNTPAKRDLLAQENVCLAVQRPRALAVEWNAAAVLFTAEEAKLG